ncbi:MAG: hypothetical protein IT169_00775 [Bryobacterales bacterium]|nr:hypothetical protein [Bryobacterales bacterium]
MATPTTAAPESLPPHKLRDAMKRSLRDTLDRMDSDEYVFALDALPEAKRNAALITRGEVFRAWRKLTNLELAAIRDELVRNEAALRVATASLNEASQDLANIEKILNAATAFLTVAAKALPIL